MCAAATPPGGIVATFIESFFDPTFFDDMPTLYLMPFQPRQSSLPRMTRIPSPPSTYFLRSSSPIGSILYASLGLYSGSLGPLPPNVVQTLLGHFFLSFKERAPDVKPGRELGHLRPKRLDREPAIVSSAA